MKRPVNLVRHKNMWRFLVTSSLKSEKNTERERKYKRLNLMCWVDIWVGVSLKYASLYYEYAYIFSWFLMAQFISCYDTKPSGLLSLISHGLIDCRRGLKLSMWMSMPLAGWSCIFAVMRGSAYTKDTRWLQVSIHLLNTFRLDFWNNCMLCKNTSCLAFHNNFFLEMIS